MADDNLDNDDDSESGLLKEAEGQTPSAQKSSEKRKGSGKTVTLWHKKKRRARSQAVAQAAMADSISKLPNSQKERWEMSMEEEGKREERFFKFREEDVERNRQHELAIARIFASAFSQTKKQSLPATVFPTPMQQSSQSSHSALDFHQEMLQSSSSALDIHHTTYQSSLPRIPPDQDYNRRYSNESGKLYENLQSGKDSRLPNSRILFCLKVGHYC